MNNRRELGFINILYGLATVLVVFGHSHPLHVEYASWMGTIIGFIYTFHMPLFFFIAGILVAYTGENRNVISWWIKKAKKLLLPYFVLTLLAWGPKMMLSQYMNDDMEMSLFNIIRIILIPRENIWGHFWFIPVYLLVVLVAAIIWKNRKMVPKPVLIGGGCLAVVATVFPIPTGWFGIRDICQEFVYVMLGMMVSDTLTKSKTSFKRNIIITSLVLSSGLFYLYKVVDNGITQTMLSKIISLLMIIFMLECSMLLSSIKLCKFIELLQYIGKHAFTIYIYSWPMQAIVELALTVVFKLDWWITFLVMFIVGLCGPLIMYELYTRFIKRNWFLDGMIGVK